MPLVKIIHPRHTFTMEFLETRCRIDSATLTEVAELLRVLNTGCRTAFARSIQSSIAIKDMKVPWARHADVYGSCDMTSHQQSMIVRSATNLRKTANTRAKYVAENLAKQASACSKEIKKLYIKIQALQETLDIQPQNKVSHEKKKQQLRQWTQATVSIEERQQRLLKTSKRYKDLSDKHSASMCFGSAKLASQRHLLTNYTSPYKDEESWRAAWREKRDQRWLFEGAKDAPSANNNVKFDTSTQILSIRLTNTQAARRLNEKATELHIPLVDLQTKTKYSSLRMESRYLRIPLQLDTQLERAKRLQQALTPITTDDPKYKTRTTKPCAEPVSWQLWIEGDINHPERCRLYARAMWKLAEVPLVTFASNGILGVDVNGWGVSLALCNAEGNKPAKKYPYTHDHTIAWNNKSQTQIQHEVRHAAKTVVDGAARLGCPLALEHLDFSDLKTRLRYEHPRTAKQVSGFAYHALQEAILTRSRKVGVEVRFVDPAWTSVVGWAKYGKRLGLHVDQAAAFCIARRGMLSKSRDIRTVTRNGDRIALHTYRENLHLHNRVGEICAPAQIDTHKNHTPTDASTLLTTSNQQSMEKKTLKAERLLATQLGNDRRQWPRKLARLRPNNNATALRKLDASDAPPGVVAGALGDTSTPRLT